MRTADQVELSALLAALREDQLSPSQWERLERLLADDVEARRYYIHSMEMSANLYWSTIAESDRHSLEKLGLPMLPENFPRKSPLLGFLAEGADRMGQMIHWPTFPTMLMLFVVSILALLVMFPGMVPWDMRGQISPAPVAVADVDFVGRLSRTIDCKWANGGAGRQQGAWLVAGRELQLTDGIAEIALDGGVRLILQGPATFLPRSPAEGHLAAGALTAWVPASARGFTVQTPLLTVVDLGTEFAVSVDPSRETEVHVFEGAVETSVKEDNTPKTVSQVVRQRKRLSAGQGLHVRHDGKQVKEVTKVKTPPSKKPAFVRVGELDKWPAAPAPRLDPGYRRWQAYHARRLNDPDLVLCYDFEDAADGWVRNAVGQQCHGQLAGEPMPAWSAGRWHNKMGLVWKGGTGQVVVADAPCLRLDGDFTVSLWCRPDALPPDEGVFPFLVKGRYPNRNYSLWLGYGGEGSKPHIHWSTNSTDGAHHRTHGRTTIQPGQWYHVVGIHQRNRMRLFLNGHEDMKPFAASEDVATTDEPLTIGWSLEAEKPWAFQGIMDDIAIWNRALSPKEVKEAFEAGKSEKAISRQKERTIK